MEIALIAHNGKKPEMVKFIMDKIDLLKHKNISIIATGTTGKYVEETGLKVTSASRTKFLQYINLFFLPDSSFIKQSLYYGITPV